MDVAGGILLEFVFVRIGSGGTARCGSCTPVPALPEYLDAEEILGALPDAVASCPTPGPNIMLGGADAFGHTALPALVGAAVREGAVRIGLETDGAALCVGGNAAGALHAGVRHVRVRYTAAERSLRGIEAWVAAASAAGVDAVATAVVPVCVHTVSEAAADVAALAEVGVVSITLEAADLTPTVATSAHLIAACDTGIVNGVWVEVTGPPDLLPASHALHRAEAGERDVA